ncbi:MAG: hypothetical protein J6B80_04960 [Clostridia bacterium]|nr:hypothetical protein [Clostridia bacterium]
MKKYLISFLCVLTTATLAVGMTGCGKENIPLKSFLSYKDQYFDSDYSSSGVVCENDKWQLKWDNAAKRVSFVDKTTGYTWGQIPVEAEAPQYQDNGTIKKNHPQLESVIRVIYQDPKSFDDVTAYSYTGAVQSDGVYVQKIDKGIRVTYDFIENEFSVPVDYTIGENSFKITVDPTKISEGEEFKIHSVAVAPFLCGMKNDLEDSWLFIPDGSGAVISPFESDGVGNVGQKYVYGKDLSYQTYSKQNPDERINMPIFGAKKGNNAIFAVITSGAEAAAINWNIGSKNIGYSSVYPEFRIRGFSYIKRPENFVTTTTLGSFKIFSDGIVTRPLEIEYFALSGKKASVYGMAECYREYLTEKSGLRKNSKDEKIATFKYIGAVVQPDFVVGIPTEKLFPLTTTKQALLMTEELSSKIGSNINIQLVGFGKTGIDIGEVAGGFTVAGKLGGTKGMKNLVSTLESKKINSFMDFDLISFEKTGAGFSKSSAAVYHGGQVVKYTSFDTISKLENQDRFFVLSRNNLFTASNKVNKKAEKLGLSGISYASLSNTVYSDYGEQKYYISGNMAEDVAKIYNSTADAGYKTLSSSANVYAAISSDYINDVPLYSSNYQISSYDVPFYQLVFKGYRSMSSVSLNLCSDKQDALLRCVESGISPSYTLYYNFDKELVTNEHTFIFGSHFEGNKEDIINTVSSVKSYLDDIKGATITDYIRLSDMSSVTKFDNGVFTVVNFSDVEIITDYGKVPAKSYITGRGE